MDSIAAVTGQYMGIRYKVVAVAEASAYRGVYTLLDEPPLPSAPALRTGSDDAMQPAMSPHWLTINEALEYGTEAAHHAIETLLLGRPQGQGRGTGSSERRTSGAVYR